MPAVRRLAVEALEDRTTPAISAVLNAGVLTVSLSANDNVTVGGLTAVGTDIAVLGNGFPQQNFNSVTSIVVNDTSGGGATGQRVGFADAGGTARVTLTGPVTVTGIETVALNNPVNPMTASGFTITGAQVVNTINALPQLSTAGTVGITATGTGDAIGTAANPIRIAAAFSLTTDTTAGNGNQFFDLGAVTNFVNVNVTLTGRVNAGTGTVTLTNGQFFGVGNGSDFGNTTTFNLGANSILTAGTNETIGGLTGTGVVASGAGAVTLSVGGGGVSSSFAGVIKDTDPQGSNGAGTVALRKVGAGTFTLSGASTYTGPTTVTGTGRLLVDGSLAAASAVTATGTDPANGLFLGGSGAANGPVVVGANAVIGPGSTTATATLATGSLSFQAGGQFGIKVAGGGAGQFDALNVTGSVNLTNGGVFVFPFGPTPAVGAVLTVIANDGADAVVGTFTNLPEGAGFQDFAGVTYRVSYVGGDGNDVTLTALAGSILQNPLLVTGPTTGTGTVYTPVGGQYQAGVQANLIPGFNGETHVALGDVTGDRVPDVIVGTGPGNSRVRVLDGANGGLGNPAVLADFIAFPGYSGGVFVAVGDLNGDGFADVAVTGDAVDAFSGPQSNTLQVRVFSGISMRNGTGNPTVLADFDGLASLNGASGQNNPLVRLGGRPAIADLNGDGLNDLLIAAGNGGGPRVTVWNGAGFANANGGRPTANPIANLFVFESTQRGGAFVTAGDITGDRLAEIVVGGGPGGGPRVRVVNAAILLGLPNLEAVNLDDPANLGNGLVLNNFFAGSGDSRGGVRVTVRDADGDGFADVVVGTGTNEQSGVRVYLAPTLLAVAGTSTEPAGAQTFDPFNGIVAGGVWVG